MSWGWTVIGTVVGSAIGGPVGAGVGMAIGRGLDSFGDTPVSSQSEMDGGIFATSDLLAAIAELFVAAASIDGIINQRERKLIHELLTTINDQLDEELDEDELDELIGEKIDDDMIISVCSPDLLTIAQTNPDFAKSLLRDCWRICAVDLVIADSELAWLIEFAEAVALPNDDFMFFALIYYRMTDSDRNQALSVLGLAPGATPEEIKCTYRKLSQMYHPDKLMHLPPEIRDLAAAKFTELTDAFKTLTTHSAWYGKLASSSQIAPVSGGEIAICFICDQKNRLPAPEHHATVRCAKCQSLLLHSRAVAEAFCEE